MSIKFEYLTDLGNAKNFVSIHGENIKYCYGSGKWLVWDGKRWMEDKDGEIHRRGKGHGHKDAATRSEGEER